MLRHLALIICIVFALYLLWMDQKKSGRSSKALWIPLIWMFFAGTRELSQWLSLRGPDSIPDAHLEGNPVDQAVCFLMIVIGVLILSRRRLEWGKLLVNNKWVLLFFLFGGLSIIWSDYPFVSFKRLIKAMGNVVRHWLKQSGIKVVKLIYQYDDRYRKRSDLLTGSLKSLLASKIVVVGKRVGE